jgi:DNA polymerase III subunit alpha
LGLSNLTIIQDTLKGIHRNHDLKIDIDKIPLDDKKTFRLLQKAKSTGVFQLESDGMKRYLKELKPTELEDIIAMVSLYRPGPMELIPEYIARKHKQKVVEYLHPTLEPILKNTYGVMVYQEQLIESVKTLAGFSRAEADVLRKAVGKKIKKLLDEQQEKFKAGAARTGTPKEIADRFWDLVEPFNRYAFNRSHAACYAMIAYQTSYLKANYPVEFMAAFMNSATGDVERIAFLIDECKQMGIEVLPPNINESLDKFTVVATSKSPTIRFGLTAIKNVGENVVKAFIAQRNTNGSFINIEDFISKIKSKDLNKKSLESLIKCGALDQFGERNYLLGNLEPLLEHSRALQKQSAMGQVSLFGESTKTSLPPFKLTPQMPAKSSVKLSWEKELLGLFISDHPLNEHKRQMKMEKVVPIDSISIEGPRSVKIGGIITRVQKIITKTGKPMLFSVIEDLSSKIEVVVFPNILEKYPDIWTENSIVIARGKINDRDGSLKLLCDDVKTLASLA